MYSRTVQYVVCCMLYVVCCMLYVVRCMWYVVCCMLYVVCCVLCVVCCMLYVVCCMLYVVCCMLYVVCCMLYVVCCMLYVVCCVVCCVLYAVIQYLHSNEHSQQIQRIWWLAGFLTGCCTHSNACKRRCCEQYQLDTPCPLVYVWWCTEQKQIAEAGGKAQYAML